MSNSANKVLVGSAWLIAARGFDRLSGVISISILARLLTPGDFGIVAIAGTVVSALEVLTTFGFDWALVRYHDPSEADLNTAWTLRAIFGFGTFIFVAALGPGAAAFYRQPALVPVLLFMGFGSFIASLENIGTVYFRRDFAFDKEFMLRSVCKIAGFVVTLSTALAFRTYWALVTGTVAIRFTGTLMSYLLHPFRPSFSLKNSRELFGFSTWLLFSNIIEYCRERFAELYLGRVFGSKPTGLFAVTGQVAIVPLTEFAAPINRAAYSKYTEALRSGQALEPYYLNIAALIWAFALPMSAGTIAVAHEIVGLVLGPQWEGAEPVLRLLAAGVAFTVMTANTQYVYWALGHSRVVAALSLAAALLLVPLTIVCTHIQGYEGAASAFALASALVLPINFTLLRRYAGISFFSLWKRVWRVTLSTSLMVMALYLLFPHQTREAIPDLLRALALKAAAGASIYAFGLCGMWLACGRPEGPEKVVLKLARNQIREALATRRGNFGAE